MEYAPAGYELKLEQYQGPLDKLLELVEEQKLEITQVSLARVTADFLGYVEKLGGQVRGGKWSGENLAAGPPPELLADFLLIASQLLLIKSKALLPSLQVTEEEETDMRNLELRLKLYQELKNTQGFIKEYWREMPQMFSREFLMTGNCIFYPPRNASPQALREALIKLVGEFEKILKPAATIKREIIHLGQKIEEIISRLAKKPVRFGELRQGKSREELVVLFLAVLHLVRHQLIEVKQSRHFEEMTIARKPEVL